VGGLLGNTVGGGTGRSVATAAGAITGAIVGGNMDRGGQYSTQSVTSSRQVCDQDYYSTRTTGYLVQYEYRGQQGSVIMESPPQGRTLEMIVNAEPARQR
jgi:uncharacterized protein YcfJ